MSLHDATCRTCGDTGQEDANDPCPGLCPPCLEEAMDRLTPLFHDWVERDGLGVGIQKAHAAMVAFGMRPEVATDFLAAAMADAS